MSNVQTGRTGKRVYCRIVDVLNNEFGCTYKGFQRGYWKKPENALGVWFPHSSRDPKDALKMNGKKQRKWRNIFRKDDTEIVEYWPSEKLQKLNAMTTVDSRYVFAKFIKKSDYIYMGIYEFVGREGTDARVYRRISKEFNPEGLGRSE